MSTTESLNSLKYFSDPDVPRTDEEVERIIRGNALFKAVAATVPDLTLAEFKQSSRAALDYDHDEREVPAAAAEAVYVAAISDHVLAVRAGDEAAAGSAAHQADAARGVLWAARDRLNELVFPWTDPDDERRNEDGDREHLY